MSRPQQPELHRSGNVPALDPDATESELEAEDRPQDEGHTGPVPSANRPGSDSGPVQDRPAPEDFVRRFSDSPSRPPSNDTADSGGSRKWMGALGAGLVAIGVVARRLRRRSD